MAQIDREVLQSLTREALLGAGISVTLKTALGMLQRLEEAYGDDFSIERACDALDSLAVNAEKIKDRLKTEFRRAQE